MYDSSGRPPGSSMKLIIVMIVAIIVVMLATVALNGGVSTPEVEENTSEDSDVDVETQLAVDYKLLGNNSYGTVTKSSGYGNPSSDIHVALIVGVDANQKSQNSIVPTLQNEKELNYCYDVYIIDALSSANTNEGSNNQNNLTVNEKSESLASEFVVPDIINNNYNFTIDVHSTNDSNSYVFVPSDNTYTSKLVVDTISNNTNVGKYTPDSHVYTEDISESIISYEIPSIVYVTRSYYSNSSSSEVSSIIHAIDTFDFVGLFSSDSDVNGDSVETNTSTNSSADDYNTITVSSKSNGNKEVN